MNFVLIKIIQPESLIRIKRYMFFTSIICFGFALSTCQSESTEESEFYPLQVQLAVELPDPETWTINECWLVAGDLNIYGIDREEAGFKNKSGLKHAGHSHGEAEMEIVVPETFLLDLSSGPVVLKEVEAQEGHYFDGYLRLRPLVELYDPVYPETFEPVPDDHELSGKTFYFLADLQLEGEQSKEVEIALELEAMVAGLIYGGTVKAGGTEVMTTVLDLKTILSEIDWENAVTIENKILIDAENNSEIYNIIKSKFQNRDYFFHLEAEEVH